jgi:hypothetical protein
MTYEEAIDTARMVLWSVDTEDAERLIAELGTAKTRLGTEHDEFPGRSQQTVVGLNHLWRGQVTTFLKWFQTTEPET